MKYEFRGKTVRDAIAKGLKKLSLGGADVEITVLDEGLRGLFAIEGKQQAVVMMEPKSGPEPLDYVEAQKLLKDHTLEILSRMNITPDAVNTTMMTGRLYANIICRDVSMNLDEETLASLETLLFEIINKARERADDDGRTSGSGDRRLKTSSRKTADRVPSGAALKIHLDSNFLIKQKEESLREEALKLARLVASDGKPRLWPGGPLRFNYRKVLHEAVREVGGVSSASTGTGEKKSVEIFPIPRI